MTPEQADDYQAAHRWSPATLRNHTRWQARWAAWCRPRGFDPETAGAGVAAVFLSVATMHDGRPATGAAARSAAQAIDAMPGRAALACVGQDDAVKLQIAAAERRTAAAAGRRAEPPPLTATAARALLARPAPPATRAATAARTVLAAAVGREEPLSVAAVALRQAGRLDRDAKREALRVLVLHGASAGTDLHDRPWTCGRSRVLQLHHRLDAEQLVRLRLDAAIALGWHGALEPVALRTAPLEALTLSRRGLALELPGGTVYARLADDPALCAHRRVRRWLNARGRDRPGDPLLAHLTEEGPDGPLLAQTWTQQFQRAATAAGMPTLRLRSLRLGYAHEAALAGASIPAIRAGMRLTDDDNVARMIDRLRQRTPAGIPSSGPAR